MSFNVVAYRLVYLGLLGLGIFFIFEGDVIQRFQLKRTNWAVYEEEIFEFPTIITYIFPDNDNITYGKDFTIKFRHGRDKENKFIQLVFGNNSFTESDISLTFENIYKSLSQMKSFPNSFMISAEKFVVGMPLDFMLEYDFANSTILSGSNIVFSLRTKNGTESCNGNYYDGEVQRATAKLGKKTKLTFVAEKEIYLKNTKLCRQKPYMDILNENIFKDIQTSCANPCKQKGNYGFCHALRVNEELEELPVCETQKENDCFWKSYEITQEYLNQYSGPCTKLHYQIRTQYSNYPSEGEDKALIQVSFDPPRTNVREEYLIYDFVAMISAIGGTMGLCIGFSFTDVTSLMLKFLEHLVNKMKRNGSFKKKR